MFPKIIFLAFSLVILLWACNGSGGEGLSEGAQIYQTHCQRCHGEDGQLGAAGAKNLATSQLDLQLTMQAIRKGSPQKGMPAYNKVLNVTEIKAVTDYVMAFRNQKK